MIAGTRIIRTRDASTSTANAIPMASIFTVGLGLITKLVKTTIMMRAAVVITRAAAPIPIATLRRASPVVAQASCTRDSRKNETATITPYAVPIDRMLSMAALVAITIDRNAAVSRKNAAVSRKNEIATTATISHTSLPVIWFVKSAFPATVPVT